MKAQLHIGNEMREGRLDIFWIPSPQRTWAWNFDVKGFADMSSSKFFSSEIQALEHFKSIGGEILEQSS